MKFIYPLIFQCIISLGIFATEFNAFIAIEPPSSFHPNDIASSAGFDQTNQIYENALVVPIMQLEDIFAMKKNYSFTPHITGLVYLKDLDVDGGKKK